MREACERYPELTANVRAAEPRLSWERRRRDADRRCTHASGPPHRLTAAHGRPCAMTPLRVLYAPRDIAGQPGTWARGIRALGVEAEVWSFGEPAFGLVPDRVWDADRLLADPAYRWDVLDRAVRRFDVFHFQYGRSLLNAHEPLLPALWDLPLLRSLGKKVFMHWHGSDVRLRSVHMAREPDSYLKDAVVDEPRIHALVEIARRHCDRMFVSTPGLLDYVPDAELVPLAIDAAAWATDRGPEPEVPVVVHHAVQARHERLASGRRRTAPAARRRHRRVPAALRIDAQSGEGRVPACRPGRGQPHHRRPRHGRRRSDGVRRDRARPRPRTQPRPGARLPRRRGDRGGPRRRRARPCRRPGPARPAARRIGGLGRQAARRGPGVRAVARRLPRTPGQGGRRPARLGGRRRPRPPRRARRRSVPAPPGPRPHGSAADTVPPRTLRDRVEEHPRLHLLRTPSRRCPQTRTGENARTGQPAEARLSTGTGPTTPATPPRHPDPSPRVRAVARGALGRACSPSWS
ncbi:hypothetical protein ACU686_07310 [Yinghuangia aomiensis]